MKIALTERGNFFQGLTRGVNQLSVSLFSVFLVFLLVWLLLLGFGKYDGDELFRVFFYNPFVNAKRMKQILLVFAPFLVGAIAVWICFQLGLINLGVGGQMAGAALAVYFVAYFLKKETTVASNGSLAWLPLLILVAITTSVVIACFCGLLRVYFGVSEILSTIFTNYIIYFLFRYLVTIEEIINPITKLSTQADVGPMINFNLGFGLFSVAFVIAIIILGVSWFVFSQTKFGLQIGLIGKSRIAAQYSGLNINRKTMIVFAISGVLAGIAGIFYYYRNPDDTFLYKSDALPSNGYDTITIVWLSQSSLVALPLTAFFIALLRVQQKVIKISAINPVIVEMMIGLIILSVAFFTKLFNDPTFSQRLKEKADSIVPFYMRMKDGLIRKRTSSLSTKTNKVNTSTTKQVSRATISYQRKGKSKE